MSATGPDGNYMTFAPQELGQNGLKHPIVAWGNGATVTSPTTYDTVIQHMTSPCRRRGCDAAPARVFDDC